jgi:hypothetical protein
MNGGKIGHLICWEQHERDGSSHAWVSRVNSVGDPVRHVHYVASVSPSTIRPIEHPGAYAGVPPRRTLGRDGRLRPWEPRAMPAGPHQDER